MKESIDSFGEKFDHLEDKVVEFKEEVLRDYVRKSDFKENNDSHEKLRIEITTLRERVAKIGG